MRPVKWVLIAVGLVALCLFAFLYRHDGYDPLQSLKPLMTVDSTEYNLAETGPPLPKQKIPFKIRFVQLSHADWNKTLAVLKDRVASEKVWRPMRTRHESMPMETPAGHEVVEVDEATWHTNKGLEGDAIEAAYYPNLKVDPGRITIQEAHVMSTWEVWWLRVKNIGKPDPFLHG